MSLLGLDVALEEMRKDGRPGMKEKGHKKWQEGKEKGGRRIREGLVSTQTVTQRTRSSSLKPEGQTVVPGLSSREPRIDSPPAAVRSLPALLQPGQKGDRVASSTAQDNCAWLLCAQYATTHGQALWAPVPTPATSTASAAVFVFYLMSFTCLVEGLTSTQTAAFP